MIHASAVELPFLYVAGLGRRQDASGDGEGAAVQWMTAGRGLLHEEMWRTGGPVGQRATLC